MGLDFSMEEDKKKKLLEIILGSNANWSDKLSISSDKSEQKSKVYDFNTQTTASKSVDVSKEDGAKKLMSSVMERIKESSSVPAKKETPKPTPPEETPKPAPPSSRPRIVPNPTTPENSEDLEMPRYLEKSLTPPTLKKSSLEDLKKRKKSYGIQ